MRITSTGKVGIGSTGPLEKLDVTGSALVRGTLNGDLGLTLGSQGGEYPGLGYNVKYTGTNNTYKYRGTDTATYMTLGNDGYRFMMAPSGSADAGIAFSTPVVINASGQVGIGTTSPSEKLEIQDGNINLTRSGSGTKAALVILSNGGVSSAACDSSIQGAMKYEQTGGTNNGHFYGCRGQGSDTYAWVQLDN